MADILAQITEIEVNADGDIPQGFLYASIKNIGGNTATINGVQLPSGEAKDYPFVGKGYQAVAYQVNTSSLRILYVM